MSGPTNERIQNEPINVFVLGGHQLGVVIDKIDCQTTSFRGEAGTITVNIEFQVQRYYGRSEIDPREMNLIVCYPQVCAIQ